MANDDEMLELLRKYKDGFLPHDGYGIDLPISAETAEYLERIERDVKRLCELVAVELVPNTPQPRSTRS